MVKDKNKSGGGAQTTVNGNTFEERMNIISYLNENGYSVKNNVVYKDNKEIGAVAKKHQLYANILKKKETDVRANIITRILLPDAVFINYLNGTMYVIEIKYQESAGSVDEKLQTCDFKRMQYKKLSKYIKGVKDVKMIYILNDYFTEERYKDVFEYMDAKNCIHAHDYTKKMLGLE